MTNSKLLEYTEDDRVAIMKEYGKTVESVAEDIEKIREWMGKQPHLPEVMGAKEIERFLLLNKFRVEVTKEKVDLYYTTRTLIPEFYDKLPTDLDVSRASDLFYFIPLPKLSKDLNRVLLTKVRDSNLEHYDALYYTIHTTQVAEIRIREDYMLSQIAIFDLSNIKIQHIASFTPSLIKKSTFILEKVFSGRMRGIHFVNVPSAVESFMSLLKSVLKPKLANRIFMHKDYESLYKIVERRVMPKDLGGEEKSLEELHAAWKKKLEEYADTLERMSKVRVNEDLRPEKLPYDEHFGMEGNFRRLQVD